MAAPTCSFSTIVSPSSSLSFLPSEPSSFSLFSPSPFKPNLLFKSLTLKPLHNFTLSPLLLPLHIHPSFSSLNDTAESITNEIPDEIEGEQVEDDVVNETDEQVEVESESESDSDESKGLVNSVDDRRLFVGNLPYSMTSSQLSETFAQAGHIQSVEIIYDKVTDRSRGFGFVTMGTADEAREAIRMFDGSQVGGRTVRVNIPEVPRGGERKVMGPKIRSTNLSFVDTPHKIYAGNLGWGVTTQGLRDAFANQEGFLSAKVIYERESGRSRGFGFITFSSADAAESALAAMNGMELEGRPLRLNMAAEKARSNTEAYAEQSA